MVTCRKLCHFQEGGLITGKEQEKEPFINTLETKIGIHVLIFSLKPSILVVGIISLN